MSSVTSFTLAASDDGLRFLREIYLKRDEVWRRSMEVMNASDPDSETFREAARDLVSVYFEVHAAAREEVIRWFSLWEPPEGERAN